MIFLLANLNRGANPNGEFDSFSHLQRTDAGASGDSETRLLEHD